jgi:hypothetical protein
LGSSGTGTAPQPAVEAPRCPSRGPRRAELLLLATCELEALAIAITWWGEARGTVLAFEHHLQWRGARFRSTRGSDSLHILLLETRQPPCHYPGPPWASSTTVSTA